VPHVSIEFVLMLSYAVILAGAAFLLERLARHAHKRSLRISTVGFTYHPDRDIWRCPEKQHLFPVFTDFTKKTIIYQAPASACNACKRKEACTDSKDGRQVERQTSEDLEYGMQRFHRVFSITLLVLASLLLVIDMFEPAGIYPRIGLTVVLLMFLISLQRLVRSLLHPSPSTLESIPGHGEPQLMPNKIRTSDK
jgi:heme A synthase